MALRLISRLIACAVFSGCAFSSALAQAPISALEQSLLAKKYSEFQKNAKLAAERGDADALFLLGKSYDLGWGVEKNRELARSYYKKAEGLGSVRAVHNLGVIALDAGQREEAIRQFQKALEKGLAMPTLWNLGRAYDPSESGNNWPFAKKIVAAEKSGDYYGQAFERSQDVEHAESAAAQFLRVKELHREEDDSGDLEGLVDEYNWRKFLAQEKALGRTLPKLPVYLKACNLNEKFKPDGTKVFFPGSYWSMGGVGVDFVEYLTIDGRVDAGGCASLAQPLPDKVREMLERGGMIFLRFPPAGRFMLDWQVKGNEVHLVPRPTGALKIQL